MAKLHKEGMLLRNDRHQQHCSSQSARVSLGCTAAAGATESPRGGMLPAAHLLLVLLVIVFLVALLDVRLATGVAAVTVLVALLVAGAAAGTLLVLLASLLITLLILADVLALSALLRILLNDAGFVLGQGGGLLTDDA